MAQRQRRRPFRPIGLVLAAGMSVIAAAVVPPALSHADPRAHRAESFASSLESGDPQPNWGSTTVRSSGVIHSRGSTTRGMITNVDSGPDKAYTAKVKAGFRGVKALHYSGYQTRKHGTAINKLFAVHIPVHKTTTLSYKIFPRLMNDDLGKGLPTPSSYVSVDLTFTDGSRLSDLRPVDQHGFGLTAGAQGASKTLYADQWNAVSSTVGTVAAGKTIAQIQLDYDNPSTGSGAFAGWVDDISIARTDADLDRDLADWVDTTRGTNANSDFSRGNTIPATAVPNGFNFWTPVTDASSSSWLYKYQESNNSQGLPELQAFGLSHLPYPWGGERHQFQVMPAIGDGTPNVDRTARAMAFRHDQETARPYYYGVRFTNGVHAEITPTDHAAVMRFGFTGKTSSLIFDNINNQGGLTLDPQSGTISGYTDVGVESSYRMYIYGTLDQPVSDSGKLKPTDRPDVAGYYQFDTTSKKAKTVTLRIATSLISVDQARHNLNLEVGNKSFAAVKAAAKRLWNDKLAVISDIRGATSDQLTTLYSNLYRLSLYPTSTSENTGTNRKPVYRHASQYLKPAGTSTPTTTGAQIVNGISYRPSNFWDTYRTSWPADALLYPRQTGKLIKGSLTQYAESGWIASGMIGSSSDVTFADAYLKKIKGFDVQQAYESAVKNATVAPSDGGGRAGLNTSIFLGYTASSTSESVSRSLEGAINDAGLASWSSAMAKTAKSTSQREKYRTNATYFGDRARSYVNLFDPETGFFRGKDGNGDWRVNADNYNPKEWGCDYTEADGWGMAFAVPQDGQGLANLYGGRKKLAAKLDRYFATPETASYPGCYGSTIHEMTESAYVQMGQWALNNQPDHNVPYMYDYAGQPYKTQKIVRDALSRQFVGSEIGQGYPGDEDTGEMSAWYIFGALGFYPLQMGTPEYAIGSPLFTSAKINLENGHTIKIKAPNNNGRNVYVQGLKINGKPYHRTTISHSVLTKGATLTFDLGPKPSSWGTGKNAAPDSITQGTDQPAPRRDLTGAQHGTAASSAGKADALFDNTSATQTTLTGSRPDVTWNFAGGSRQAAEQYTLTSAAAPDQGTTKDKGSGANKGSAANKGAAGDPTSWRLQGSQDGKRWTTIDRRTRQSFDWRQQTRAFTIKHPKAYRHYRLVITGSTGTSTALSEIELLGRAPSTAGHALTASFDNRLQLMLPQKSATDTSAELQITATAPKTADVRIGDIEAPDGWTVKPQSDRLSLASNGRPVQGKLPVAVTAPSGTAEGNYQIAVTASLNGAVPVRSVITIRVTSTIDFTPGTDEEQLWLSDPGRSSMDDAGENRYADNDASFTYTFALPEETSTATAKLVVDNEYRIQASNDGTTWSDVLVEDQEIHDGSNRAEHTVDLSDYLGSSKTLWLKVSDSYPNDGWGGRLGHLTLSMS